VFLAIIITNYFVKPLHTLSRYFSQLTIGRKNITIPIFRKDELGQLIELYNEMVVQLDETVHQLKERERESAWKEVAKQVAHEIKNPLTPIKLGLQFLIRAKQANDPDWNERFRSFSDTLLVQIESMTQMANSFSEFTRLPEAVYTQVKIDDLLAPAVMVLNEFKGSFDVVNGTRDLVIQCDKMQIIRVLVNLLKNAEQAVRGNELAKIQFTVNQINNEVHFSIFDNGVGIANENVDQIFKPNFTTKSSGMGLGLFMSKVIIDNHRGKLWFDSKLGEGTSFYIILPIDQSVADANLNQS
jgi:two-component system nitrogen regulation sensor histidine kinase NtrY